MNEMNEWVLLVPQNTKSLSLVLTSYIYTENTLRSNFNNCCHCNSYSSNIFLYLYFYWSILGPVTECLPTKHGFWWRHPLSFFFFFFTKVPYSSHLWINIFVFNLHLNLNRIPVKSGRLVIRFTLYDPLLRLVLSGLIPSSEANQVTYLPHCVTGSQGAASYFSSSEKYYLYLQQTCHSPRTHWKIPLIGSLQTCSAHISSLGWLWYTVSHAKMYIYLCVFQSLDGIKLG